MLAIAMSFQFDFKMDWIGRDQVVFHEEDIVGRRIGMAFCSRCLGQWSCIDELNNELNDFRVECSNSYIEPQCKLVFSNAQRSTVYSNFAPSIEEDDINTITPPEDYPYSTSRTVGSPVRLEDISSLLFRRGDKTESKLGEHFDELIPMAGNKLVLDKLFCKNVGFDGQKVNWDCSSADISRKYRLYDVSISCEGWSRPGDNYIVPGSCYASYLVRPK